ncbi:uncharacterized protein B0H18DRAFT_17490 [Fomitopsis serialis]|uniref:uncharacterized protein n=1 Tax=Fomitopsis serialis TaxID=139415 RepID=UPI002008A24C|nr:uncharacterized protein B0H18DRAFT_17490 [Neoantrodia serialis]KAH9938502.1 hypothetical protein B0H18DRAFT_17490 [Neoantrodia serialis]
MSRHRFVRNINVQEELEDDYASDGGEADMDPEEYEQMMEGLERVRITLGSPEQSGLSDQEIKDTCTTTSMTLSKASTI